MEILISDIFDKCSRLSSYEAGKNAAVGDELYSIIHITERDNEFLVDTMRQAAGSIASILRFAITGYDVNTTTSKLTFDVISDSSLNRPTATKFIAEIISTYCMSVWLSNKIPDRSQSYMGMYTELMNNLVKSIHRLRPILEPDDNND